MRRPPDGSALGSRPATPRAVRAPEFRRVRGRFGDMPAQDGLTSRVRMPTVDPACVALGSRARKRIDQLHRARDRVEPDRRRDVTRELTGALVAAVRPVVVPRCGTARRRADVLGADRVRRSHGAVRRAGGGRPGRARSRGRGPGRAAVGIGRSPAVRGDRPGRGRAIRPTGAAAGRVGSARGGRPGRGVAGRDRRPGRRVSGPPVRRGPRSGRPDGLRGGCRRA